MLLQRQEKSLANAQARLIACKNQHLNAAANDMEDPESDDEQEEIELISNHGNQQFVNI